MCDLVSLDDEVVSGSLGIKVVSDLTIRNFSLDEYDMIVLPGGLPGADNLMESSEIIDLVKYFASNHERFIGAICAAPQVLAKARVINDKMVTSYPDDKYRGLLSNGIYKEDIVLDGKIIIKSLELPLVVAAQE